MIRAPTTGLKLDHKNTKPRHVAENPWNNFFHIKLLGHFILTLNVKMNQCCPQLKFLILMVRLYNVKYVLDRIHRDRYSMKKPFRSSARDAGVHTKHFNANIVRVVSLDANSYLVLRVPSLSLHRVTLIDVCD
jgi:protein gp37